MNTRKIFFSLLAISFLFAASCTTEENGLYDGIDRTDVTPDRPSSIDRTDVTPDRPNTESIDRTDVTPDRPSKG